MVRRESCYLFSWITLAHAHIGGSQLTRTVLFPGPSRMLSECFIVICGRNLRPAADFCLATLIIRANGCQGLAAKRCAAPLAGSWTDDTSCRLFFYIFRHHSPHKTCQFPRNRRHCYVPFLSMPYQPVVLAPHSCVCLVRIGYHPCGIPLLALP